MAPTLRLIDITVASSEAKRVRGVLAEHAVIDSWEESLHGDLMRWRVLASSTETEGLTDKLDHQLGVREDFRIVLLGVEATLPRVPDATPVKSDGASAPDRPKRFARVNREELYGGLAAASRLDAVYLVMTLLSALVASVGLLRDSVAVLIAAMVIAPLLGPNMALALGTTLGDGPLIRRAIVVNVAGAGVAFAVAVVTGLMLEVPMTSEILARTVIGPGDLVLALACGAAGALAVTTGLPSTLIGVMVAVALVPPIVVAGLSVAEGAWSEAVGALVLTGANVVCLNLSAIGTFFLQGVQPFTWWEKANARRAIRLALALWLGLLAILVTLIVVSAASA